MSMTFSCYHQIGALLLPWEGLVGRMKRCPQPFFIYYKENFQAKFTSINILHEMKMNWRKITETNYISSSRKYVSVNVVFFSINFNIHLKVKATQRDLQREKHRNNFINQQLEFTTVRIKFECFEYIFCLKNQFSSVAQSCPTLCDPMDCIIPGFHVLHQLPELAQTQAHRVSDAIQPSHPLSSPSPPTFNLSQHQGLFQRVSSHQVAKVLEHQLQHESFQ